MYWFYVLPLGFLLTQYTITGFDASAHVSEETKGASISAAKGVWRSIFYSALIGWFVLLAITFAANDVGAINEAGGGSLAIFDSALTLTATKVIVAISTFGQLFCGVACLTSASRMCFAFSRDKGLPGSARLSKVNSKGVPVAAVITMAIAALLITLPALEGDGAFPYAFFAVVSITVIGLYIAYVIPIFLRWRMGDAFEPGPWNNGKKYKWMNPFATFWVGLITIIFCLPFTPGRRAVGRHVRLEGRELRPDHRDHGAADRGHLVEGQRPQALPGHRPPGRPRGGRPGQGDQLIGRPHGRPLASGT